jgi:hypothetical protein
MKTEMDKKKVPYGRVTTLRDKLQDASIDAEVIAEIMQGGDEIVQTLPPKIKAAWMKAAMLRMDRLLDAQTRHSVREACACCLGGKRQELSKAIAQQYQTLDERIAAADHTPFVFGHSVSLQPDGKVLVSFAAARQERYDCPCLRHADVPMPVTYCYCCGGHVKHHLQNALARPLTVEVLYTALSTGWKQPCTFLFSFAG